MFKRAFLIRLKDDAPPEGVAGLVRDLEAAPNFVPTMVYSKVRREQSRFPYDLVWDHAFTDVEAYRDYLVHPYHANIADEFLLRGAPKSVFAEGFCICWEDEEIVDPLVGTEPAAVQAAKAFDPFTFLPVDAPAGDTIYLLEQIDVVPGKTAEYLEAHRTEFEPNATARGMKLVGSWQSPPDTGEEELTFLWAVEGWGNWHRIRVELLRADPDAYSSWLARIEPLRTGGRRRFLLQTPDSQTSVEREQVGREAAPSP